MASSVLIFLGLPTFPLLSDLSFCDRSFDLVFFSFSKAAASASSFS